MAGKNRRNQFDNKDSLEIGDSAQAKFAKIAIAKGWQVIEANPDEDINDHWDFLLSKADRSSKIDVKDMKRISRHDSEVQDSLFWIELHGVRPYDSGWLYNGKATHIAFETFTGFIIVKRKDLISLVESIVDFDKIVDSPHRACYCVYSRSGRPDKITLISKDDVLTLNHAFWENKGEIHGK